MFGKNIRLRRVTSNTVLAEPIKSTKQFGLDFGQQKTIK
jgi:hypothetical protein